MDEATNEHLNLLITLNEIRQALAVFGKHIRSTQETHAWLESNANSTKGFYSDINEKQASLGRGVGNLLQLIDKNRVQLHEQMPLNALSDELQRNLRSLNNRMNRQSGRILHWLCSAKPLIGNVSYASPVPIRVAIHFEGVVDEKKFPRGMYIETEDFLIKYTEEGDMYFRFGVSTTHPKLIDSALLCPPDFVMNELMRVLMEHGGLGWADLLQISIMTLNNNGQKSWLDVY